MCLHCLAIYYWISKLVVFQYLEKLFGVYLCVVVNMWYVDRHLNFPVHTASASFM